VREAPGPTERSHPAFHPPTMGGNKPAKAIHYAKLGAGKRLKTKRNAYPPTVYRVDAILFQEVTS